MKPELPILASTRERLAALERDPRFSAKELEQVLALDPALVIAVLHRAIHIQHRHIDSHITTLLQAAMMLGIGPILGIARELPLAEETLSPQHLPLYKTALARAALSGRFGLLIAHERHELEPGEISLSSLLAPLGELALWKVAADDMYEFELLRRQPGVHPQQAAYVIFGIAIGELGHTEAAAWGLPDLLLTTLDPHQPLSARGIGPLLASRLAWHALGDWLNERAEADLRACAHHLEVDFHALTQQIDEIVGKFEEEAGALYDLPQLPVLSGTQIMSMPPPPKPALCQATDRAALVLGEQRVRRARDLDEVVNALLESCYSGLGMDRVVFARRHTDDTGARLEAVNMIGTDYEYKFHRLDLTLDGRDLFTLMLRKPSAVWMRGNADPKLAQLVPPGLIQLTGVAHFFCVSLFVGSTPAGILYADRRHTDCQLTDAQFAAFKRLGALANKLLTRPPAS